MAWCPQAGSLVPMLSVFHNIYMGALARHSTLYNLRTLLLPSAAEKHAVGELAQTLGLEDKLFTSVDRLSGGQAQRVALGRALYTRRPVLLADEPVSSLDEHQGLTLLRHTLAQHTTAVVALHDRSLALACCQRIIGLIRKSPGCPQRQPVAGGSLADPDLNTTASQWRRTSGWLAVANCSRFCSRIWRSPAPPRP